MSSSMPSPLPARAHRKSRAGCRTCKSRKVKCDEQRPACAKCIKYNVRCDFLGKQESSTPTPGAASGSDGLNLADLELLHNYITATVSTMNESPIIRDFYKTTVIKMGLSCDYIMRAALAISSLHLAHYRPHLGEHYRSLAIAHHQAASSVALTKMAQDITPDTARDLFVFSILTVFFALGCPRKENDFLLIGESGFPDWMFLLQGTRSFIEIGGLAHQDGPLATLIQHGAYRLRMQGFKDGNDDHTTPAQVSLSRLQEMISQQEADENLQRIYASSINDLRESFAMIVDRSCASQDIADAFVWIYMNIDEFIPLLRQPTQPALAIFAYFCVLLKKLDAQWWLHGWADHLMRKLNGLLDEEHRLWIQWPMEEMGYVA